MTDAIAAGVGADEPAVAIADQLCGAAAIRTGQHGLSWREDLDRYGTIVRADRRGRR